MDKLSYYNAARYLAWGDIISSSLRIILMCTIASVLHCTNWLDNQHFGFPWHENEDSFVSKNGLKTILTVCIGVSVIFYLILMWSAVMFLRHVKPGKSPEKALYRTKIWRRMIFLVLLIDVIPGIRAYPIRCILELIIRSGQLCVIRKFKKELKMFAEGIPAHLAPPGSESLEKPTPAPCSISETNNNNMPSN